MPAALSRIYAGMRGVVSWRYLASEQIIRQHQRSKMQTLHALMSDPKLLQNITVMLDGHKATTEQIKYVRSRIKTIMGGRLVFYNDRGEEKFDDEISDEEFSNSFSRGFYNLTTPLRASSVFSSINKRKEQKEQQQRIKNTQDAFNSNF